MYLAPLLSNHLVLTTVALSQAVCAKLTAERAACDVATNSRPALRRLVVKKSVPHVLAQ